MELIRSLRKTDKDDVLEIAKHTWEGHDYLPYFFASWINDPNSHTAAIEKDGHVIALANLRVIENGQTGWMEGLRVHPDYRGQGFASVLTTHFVKLAKEIPVKRIRYTTGVGNETSLHLGDTVGMRRKFDLAVHWQNRMDEVSWCFPDQSIEEISSTELHPLLMDAELLPDNVVIYDWKAIDATHEGLQRIGPIVRFWVQKKQKKIESMSVGFVKEDQTGPQWCFTIYAQDDLTFLSQLGHHVKMTSDAKCNTIFVTYQMDFVETLYSLDWVRPTEDEEMALTLFERVL